MEVAYKERFHTGLLDRLNESIENRRFPHAMMFLGKEGSGAIEAALEVSRSILRLDKDASEAMEKMLTDLAHPDWHFIYPFVKVSSGGTDHVADFVTMWRDQVKESPHFNLDQWVERIAGDSNKQALIPVSESGDVIRKLNFRSHSGGYKVLFMWLPEKLHPSAANKLLKIIEEPPEKTIFVIVSENQEEVLPTIVSRTQVYRIPTPQDDEVANYLMHVEGVEQGKAQNIAAVVEGNVARARQLALEDVEDGDHHQLFVEWMRVCYKKDVTGMIDTSESLAEYKRVRVQGMLEYSLHIFRQCLIGNYAGPSMTRLTPAQAKFAKNFAPFVNGRNVEELMEDFNEAHYHIGRNGNAKIILLDLSFKVMRHLRK